MNLDNARQLDEGRPERSFLGGLMIDPAQLPLFLGDLKGSDFRSPYHGALYDLLAQMAEERQGIDLVSVITRVQILNADRFGGAAYIAQLPEQCPSTTNLRTYADLIIEHARIRRLRQLSVDLANAAHGTGPFADMPAAEIADEWIPRLAELALVRGAKKPSATLAEAWKEAEDERLDREAGALSQALTTGFPKLDALIACRPGDLVVIGGEPSMGKSALAQAFAMEFALQQAGVLYCSLEMPRRRIVRRLAAYVLHLSVDKLGKRELTAQEELDVQAFERDLKGDRYNLVIHDRPRLTISQVAAEARAMWSRGGLRAVFIDHLHLMNHGRWESRNVAIAETTSKAKELALDLQIPVFLLAQLNRTAQRRADPRKRSGGDRRPWWDEVAQPELADLRDSGAIEADADVVLFPMHATKCGLPDDSYNRRAGCVIVAKQRDGALGTVGVAWDGPCAAYRPYEQPLFDGVAT